MLHYLGPKSLCHNPKNGLKVKQVTRLDHGPILQSLWLNGPLGSFIQPLILDYQLKDPSLYLLTFSLVSLNLEG